MRRLHALALAAVASVWPSLAGAEMPPLSEEKRQELTDASRAYRACIDPQFSDKRFAPLRAKSPYFAGKLEAAAKQLRDRAKPTAAAAKLVAEFKSGLLPCRQKFLERLAELPPGYAAVYRTSYEKIDAVLGGLERRETPWGEANTAITKVQKEAVVAVGRAQSQ